MDPADPTAQFVDWRDDWRVVSEGNVDLMKILEAVYAFKGKLLCFSALVAEGSRCCRTHFRGGQSGKGFGGKPRRHYPTAPSPSPRPSPNTSLQIMVLSRGPGRVWFLPLVLLRLPGRPLPRILRWWPCLWRVSAVVFAAGVQRVPAFAASTSLLRVSAFAPTQSATASHPDLLGLPQPDFGPPPGNPSTHTTKK